MFYPSHFGKGNSNSDAVAFRGRAKAAFGAFDHARLEADLSGLPPVDSMDFGIRHGWYRESDSCGGWRSANWEMVSDRPVYT